MSAALWRRTLMVLLSLMIVSACARHPVPPPTARMGLSSARGDQLHGMVVDLSSRTTLAFDTFVKTVARAQVVAVGEEHYHPDIQAFELRLLQALAQHHPRHIALAMEFLERDMQAAVDAYLSGHSDDTTLHMQIKATPAFIQYYFPLLQYARQAGIPVLAMNVPRSLARRVTREGLPAVAASIPLPERAYMAATFLPITPSYRTYFRQAVAAAHPLPEEQHDRFVEAAHLKDDTMAESLANFLEGAPDTTVLAIAGRFHFDYGLAIPALLRQRRPHVTIRRVTATAVAAETIIDLQGLAQEALADYVWFALPRPETMAAH